MSHVELSTEEQELLTELLQNSLMQLEVEIERTDSHDFREGLKRRRAAIKTLLEKAGTPIHEIV